MMGVGFVFGAFASAALCYRSKTMSPHNYWIELCIYKMCQAKGALIKLYVYMYGCLGKMKHASASINIELIPFWLAHFVYTNPHPEDMCPKNVVYCVLLMLPLSFYWLMCIFLYWCIAYFRKSIFCLVLIIHSSEMRILFLMKYYAKRFKIM